MMAARSLIQLFRSTRPELLHKRDRGRPTEASTELENVDYGKVVAKDYIPGAEVLLQDDVKEIEIDSESGSDDEQWIDVEDSDNNTESLDESEIEEEETGENADKTDGSKRKVLKASKKLEQLKMKKELAQKVTSERLLTDQDFKRIDMENVRKQIDGSKKGVKRKLTEVFTVQPSELVKLSDIENIYKKRKHDKQTRIESVKKGQDGREKFGYKDGRVNEHCSKTNREKRKKKNFQMLRHKAKGKVKRSFKDKQIALRNHLLKLKKMK